MHLVVSVSHKNPPSRGVRYSEPRGFFGPSYLGNLRHSSENDRAAGAGKSRTFVQLPPTLGNQLSQPLRANGRRIKRSHRKPRRYSQGRLMTKLDIRKASRSSHFVRCLC